MMLMTERKWKGQECPAKVGTDRNVCPTMFPCSHRRSNMPPLLPSHKRRRLARRIVFGIVTVLVLWLAIKSAPSAWHHVQILYWQHQAMTYTAPADRVVYDDDPADAANLRKANPSLITDAHGEVFDFAKPWDRFYWLISPPGRQFAATLFLHAMQNAEGETRLVVVEAYSSTNEPMQKSINTMPSLDLRSSVLEMHSSRRKRNMTGRRNAHFWGKQMVRRAG